MKTTETTSNAQPLVDSTENSWFTNGKWIPLANMSNTHLRKAKIFAQKREEQYFRKMLEYGKQVEKLEEEAERRGIKLADFPSRFQENSRVIKNAIKRDELGI